MQNCDIGIIGLAVMGRSLALNMADHGFRVAAYNRSPQVTEEILRNFPHKNVVPFYTLKALTDSLKRPRKVMLMVKAGSPVDAVLHELLPLLDKGDIIMDGGNSFFEDTRRRGAELKPQGLHYFGVGVSGGEEGARYGPSIMPGGDYDIYTESVRPILESIAARAQGEPCCAWMGPDGAGHYVKMVHNGIEYADMQLIAEAYLLLKYAGGFDNHALSDLFYRWNEGELRSYLIGITADILKEPDDFSSGELPDYIEDSAAQKGTGQWTVIEALKQCVDVSLIAAAGNARLVSNRLTERAAAAKLLDGPAVQKSDNPAAFAETVRRGLYAAKIAAYSQGFSLLQDASKKYSWNLNLGAIASVFRAGCIIQAVFLDDITRAFRKEPAPENLILDGFFLERIRHNTADLRAAAAAGIGAGLPLPAMTGALSFIDAFRGSPLGANLIQAQRDCFGAHTYRRIDREGIFHHEWGTRE